MIVVSLILFLLLETELTGDPATRVLGQFSNEEQRELWREQHGYNQPVACCAMSSGWVILPPVTSASPSASKARWRT
jgi:ABC-type dipeptide/oligopeptide/nickel transport system permease component